MTDKQFYTLFGAALAAEDRDAYVSDWCLSDIWADPDNAVEIPPERVDIVGAVWDVAHLTIRDIRQHTGLSQVKFALHYCIPRRTLEDWESGERGCPDYLRLLLAQSVGLYERV